MTSFLLRKSNRTQPFLDEALKTIALVEDFGLASPSELALANRIISGLCWRGRFDDVLALMAGAAAGNEDNSGVLGGRIALPEESELSCVDIVLNHFDRVGDLSILERLASEVVLPMVCRRVEHDGSGSGGAPKRLHLHHDRFLEELEKRTGRSPALDAVLKELRALSLPPPPPSDDELERLIAEQVKMLPVACVGSLAPKPRSVETKPISFPWSFFSPLTGKTPSDSGNADDNDRTADFIETLSDPDANVDWGALGRKMVQEQAKGKGKQRKGKGNGKNRGKSTKAKARRRSRKRQRNEK